MKTLEELHSIFAARSPKSYSAYQESCKIIPGGVCSNVKYYAPYPLFMKNSSGAFVYDLDDNEYIDYCMALGPIILGHGHPAIRDAILKIIDEYGTTILGTPTEIEMLAAKNINSLIPSMEKIRFCNSGLEATQNAIRFARTYSRKEKVMKFEGHYHGAYDFMLTSSYPEKDFGIPEEPIPVASSPCTFRSDIDNIIVSTFNDPESTEKIIKRNSESLAAIIMEPIPRGYLLPDREFLASIREITQELDIPLIFDEVMSGFRVHKGGAQAIYNVKPDITCLGKIIGGGLPVGAFGGRQDIMELCDPSKPGSLLHGGTFNGCPTVLAAGNAVLEEINSGTGFDDMVKSTEYLKEGLTDVFNDRGVPAAVIGAGANFNLFFTDLEIRRYRDTLRSNKLKRAVLDLHLINSGIFLRPGKAFYTSFAHTNELHDRLIEAASAAEIERE